jgi:hypothetical protein
MVVTQMGEEPTSTMTDALDAKTQGQPVEQKYPLSSYQLVRHSLLFLLLFLAKDNWDRYIWQSISLQEYGHGKLSCYEGLEKERGDSIEAGIRSYF